jgi:hypothetical protein
MPLTILRRWLVFGQVQHEGCELLVELCNFKGGRYVVAVRLLSTFTPALANHLADLTAHVIDILL